MGKQNSNRNGEDEIDEIVETLLDQPVGNLEERVKQIETKLAMRRVLLGGALSSLGTHQLRLEERIGQMHYRSAVDGSALARKTALEQDMTRTEFRKIDEWLSYFSDAIRLQEQLQEAKEELALEREKRRLVK
ncbi:MAG: hypothetical protein IIA59_06800 [Candidatus Marinimicrobia bacterium]|nr:hypothetical protein [Candidatus Neomarinimicrobiota bacterium]